jgi:broad specificity phosphatase PhoE
MRVYLIRRAESTHDVTLNISELDPPLTSNGISQCASYTLPQETVNLILTSTSSRAIQTAKNIFANSNLPIYATDLLLEFNTGAPCNNRKDMTTQMAEFPDVNFTTYQVDPLPTEINWSDGVVRSNRILDLLRNIRDNSPEIQTVAIVSHRNILRSLIYELTNQYVQVCVCEHYCFDL